MASSTVQPNRLISEEIEEDFAILILPEPLDLAVTFSSGVL